MDEIRCRSIKICPTYAGLLIGVPDEELNYGFIVWAKKQAQQLREDAPVHVIDPETREVDVGLEHPAIMMPDYTVLACLETLEPEGMDDGRHLCIVFFIDDALSRPIDDYIKEQVSALDWRAVSSTWSF